MCFQFVVFAAFLGDDFQENEGTVWGVCTVRWCRKAYFRDGKRIHLPCISCNLKETEERKS